MSTDDVPHVPDLILEQYRLNELPLEEADRVKRLLNTHEALRIRLDALTQSDEEIARVYPAGWLAARIRSRLPAKVRHRPAAPVRRLILVSVVATAMVVMLVPQLIRSTTSPVAGERVKGIAPSLILYRRTATGSETLADGAPARAGDLLRIGYVAAGRDYGLILSIDGRGLVTRHLPASGTAAASLRKDGTILLDHAYELDDAPAWERFYFVTADEPFDVEPILETARRVAAGGPRVPERLPLPRDFGQSTFAVQKEVRP